MSKGSLLFGTGSGKLGSVVMSRTKGQERHRAYISKVKNPRSFSQMVTRIAFSTAGLAYKGLKGVSQKLSYNGFGANSYNSFIKSNLSLAPFYSKEVFDEMSSKGLFPVAPWVISNGALVPPSLFSSLDISNAPNWITYDLSLDVSYADLFAFLGASEVGVDHHDPSWFLSLFWHFASLPPTLHICALCGTISQIDVQSYVWHPCSIDMNKLRFCELFPYSSSIEKYSQYGYAMDSEGALFIPSSAPIPLVSPEIFGAGESHHFVSMYSEIQSIELKNTFHLVFHIFKGESSTEYTSDAALYSFWVVDSIKRTTSFASLKWIESSVSQEYNNAISEQRKKEVVPTWEQSSSSSNASVYSD